MLLSLILIIVIGLVAYFHYTQGLFSAGISAVLATISALVAMGYHEVAVATLLRGRFADQANAIMLVSIFAFTYIVLRVIFDKLIPGNVLFPAIVDKIGAGVCGVIAGMMAGGILAIATQSLPYSESIAMATRYPVRFEQTTAIKQNKGAQKADALYDEVDEAAFLDGGSTGLWVPADDMVVALTRQVSGPNGSLATGTSFAAIHPDYLQELFGQRMGIQTSSKHTATDDMVEILGVFRASANIETVDQEAMMDGTSAVGHRAGKARKLVVNKETDELLVVRVKPHRNISDEKKETVAMAPGGVRLVVGEKNHFAVGTVDAGRTLFLSAPDDPIFVLGDKAADFAFVVPKAVLYGASGEGVASAARKIAPGTFIEVKRLSRTWLAGKEPVALRAGGDIMGVVRKGGAPASDLKTQINPENTGQQATGNSPFRFVGLATGGRMENGIDVGAQREGDVLTAGGVSGSLKGGKFSLLNIDGSQTVAKLRGLGNNTVDQLYAPAGQTIVQISGRAEGQGKWEWAENLGKFELVDRGGKKYAPHGAIATLVVPGSPQKLLVQYDSAKAVTVVSRADDTPGDVVLLFVVPSGTDISELSYGGQQVQSISRKVQ